jgi:hypothetical protein
MVALHKEAVTEGLTVFQHNAEPMISIASKSSKFAGFTPKQAQYVIDVVADKVHAKITWAAMAEVDPVTYNAAMTKVTPMVEPAMRPEILGDIEVDLHGSEPGFGCGLPFEEDLDEPTATTNNANWGMF